jgi:hypothetical protein
MRPLRIHSGRIIDPSQGIDETGSLIVSDSNISWLGKGEIIPPGCDYDGIEVVFRGSYVILGKKE